MTDLENVVNKILKIFNAKKKSLAKKMSKIVYLYKRQFICQPASRKINHVIYRQLRVYYSVNIDQSDAVTSFCVKPISITEYLQMFCFPAKPPL